MNKQTSDTDVLLDLAADGDSQAVARLLVCNRDRLARMIAVRMGPQLSQRVDASDVVQETMAAAVDRLPGYLQQRPIPFYPWLRQIAWQKLVELNRRHIGAQRRSVGREASLNLPDESQLQLVDRLMATGSSPSMQVMRKEMRHSVRQALVKLPERDREVLVLLYLEQLSIEEIAAILSLTERAVTMRHLRALDRHLFPGSHSV